MAKVIPFRGLRYNNEKFQDLHDVTAPPYDTILPAEQEELYHRNAYNVARLDCGKTLAGDDEQNNRYTRSAAYFEEWLKEQILVEESQPAFYICEQIFSLGKEKPCHSLKGIIGLVELQEFSKGVILPHEETVTEATEDRLKLMKSTHGAFSQIYSLYLDENKEIAGIIEEQSDAKPDITFVTEENITRNIWVITDAALNARISKLFEEKQIFIADGHTRYEAAVRYRNHRREEDGSPEGTRDYDYVMMLLVSMEDGGLFVFPTHRLIKNLGSFDEILLVGSLTDEFAVSKIYFTEGDYATIMMERLTNTVDETLFGLYTGGNYYYLLKLKDTKPIDAVVTDKSSAYTHLDVTVLHELILRRYMGIDEENTRSQKNLDYTKDAQEAVQAVKDGEADCVFLTNPPKVSEIKEVALAREKMPQKSTRFWPKLVTGVVMHRFER